jgi:predicted phosphodiesterase
MKQIATPSRIAVIADIHGNPFALEAVLADIQQTGGADAYWLLGDYVAIGPDPLGSLRRLEKLNNATLIRGNTDRLVVDITESWPVTAEELADPAFIDLYARVNRSMAWTAGAVSCAGYLPWLVSLPVEQRFLLPDGSRVLIVHASPGTDDGPGFHPNQNEEERRQLLAGAEADLLFVGHTHLPLDFTLEASRVINPGSVGNPLPPDLRACYVRLDVDKSGYQVSFHEADYDHDQVLELTKSVNHPAYDYIRSFLAGERRPAWLGVESEK